MAKKKPKKEGRKEGRKEASKQASKQASTSCSPWDLVCCWKGGCVPHIEGLLNVSLEVGLLPNSKSVNDRVVYTYVMLAFCHVGKLSFVLNARSQKVKFPYKSRNQMNSA